MTQGIARKNRGLGASPSVPRATQEDLETAVSEFKAALRLEPDNHQASFGLAEVLLQLGKNEEATAILQTLAKNNDDWARHAQRKLTKVNIPATK